MAGTKNMDEQKQAHIEFSKPPHWERITKVFPAASWEKPIAIAYGNTIYTNVKKVQKHLIVHESVHLKQQEEEGPEAWWEKYFTNVAFRLEQEVPAYRAQWLYVKERNSVKVSDKFLDACAFALSGDLYGNLIPYHEARNRIRRI